MSSFLSSFSRLSLLARPSLAPSTSALFAPAPSLQVRHKSLLPRKTKYRKSHKGRIPIALGGSTKGTTLEWGEYGLRVNEPCRLSAKHLESAEAALKRGLKPYKGCKVSVYRTRLVRRPLERNSRSDGIMGDLRRGRSEIAASCGMKQDGVLIQSASRNLGIFEYSRIFQFASKCVFLPSFSRRVTMLTRLRTTGKRDENG